MESIPLSQALPEETDRNPLTEGVQLAITGILIEQHTGKGGKSWETAKINGISLPDGKDFVKYKSASGPIVRQCRDLLAAACYESGECKKPVRVKVEGRDGTAGRYLILVDA